MELFATLLCMFSMMGVFLFITILVLRRIKKKPKTKIYSRGLLVSALVFVLSIVLFGIFQTPESRAKYEQQRIEAQREKEEKEQAEKEQAEKEQAEKEQAKKEQAKKEQKSKSETKDNSQNISPEENLKETIIKVIGEENLETFNYVPDNNFALIKFKGSENLSSKMTVKGMYMDISNILKGIQKDINVNVDVNVTYPLQDKYGNTSEDIVIKATFNSDTIKKINFDNFDYNDIPSVADEWWNHNALNITD